MTFLIRVLACLLPGFLACSALAAPGAIVPWMTYEAESMTVSGGFIQGPNYTYNNVVAESSGRRCARLNGTGQYLQFTCLSNANAMVLRYSVPDSSTGGGADYTLSVYKNDTLIAKLPLTSKYSWLYGAYPYTNTPGSAPRNFYDEVRTNGLAFAAGDVIRLQKNADDTAAFYDIDLVDLEVAAAPVAQPAGSLSILDYGAGGAGTTEDTAALRNCIAAAVGQGKSVWLPSGTYKITGSISLPSNTAIQGAGMWYSTLVGDPALYSSAANRVAFKGAGSNIQLSDFAIVGKLNYRNDSEPNDGLVGSYGTGSRISRVWVEHTKTGAWIVNSQGLIVEDCRFRDTVADGINLCVGMRGTVVTNCTARGTGDDCFAIWPGTYLGTPTYAPGLNTIRNCTGQAAFLANGGAIYGGEANKIEDCLFLDMTYGCGVLLSTTFNVSDGFSGTTVVQRSDLVRCGGFDASYSWRAALQFCLQNGSISGVNVNTLNITNSASDGAGVIYGSGSLQNAVLAGVRIPDYGKGVSGRHGLWARSDAVGSLTVSNSAVVDFLDDSPTFAFNFVTSAIPVTVQSSPAGRAFTVDGLGYTDSQVFSWMAGSSHTIATTNNQSGGTGAQYVWSSWSDSGAMSHAVGPLAAATYTVNFTPQYYLTMTAGPGGSVSPSSGWRNAGVLVGLTATASNSYAFESWNGTGSGSYSGGLNAVSIVMNAPITQAAVFRSTLNQLAAPLYTSDGRFLLSYQGTPGYAYALERTPSLAPPIIWSPVSTNMSGTNGIVSFTNTFTEPVNLFRVRQVTAP